MTDAITVDGRMVVPMTLSSADDKTKVHISIRKVANLQLNVHHNKTHYLNARLKSSHSKCPQYRLRAESPLNNYLKKTLVY